MEAATDIPAGEARPPWTVLAYIPVSILWMVTYRVVEDIGFPIGPSITGAIIILAVGFGLYRGSRAAWVIALILLAFPILALPNSIASGLLVALENLLGVAALLYLLLHPATRAWCSRSRSVLEKSGARGRPTNVESAVTEQGRRWDRH